jgi:hypothetical protein
MNKPKPAALPYAETVSYWKTGKSQADRRLQEAVSLIEKRGGKIRVAAWGQDPDLGRECYCVQFVFGAEEFRLVWPVLPTRKNRPEDLRSARLQAATLLFYDVKAKLLAAEVLGIRQAFFSQLLLPDGKSVVEHSNDPMALPQILNRGLPAPESHP